MPSKQQESGGGFTCCDTTQQSTGSASVAAGQGNTNTVARVRSKEKSNQRSNQHKIMMNATAPRVINKELGKVSASVTLQAGKLRTSNIDIESLKSLITQVNRGGE